MSHWHYSPEFDAIMATILGVEDVGDLHLFGTIKASAHLMGQLASAHREEAPLSPARMRLLIRLAIDEQKGGKEGLSPSELSRYSGVSRNTISALLNGLEEQQLIERHLNPVDRRQFSIRITPAGQDLIRNHAPRFATFVSSLLDPLSPDERATLQTLLDKLFNSLVDKAADMGLHTPLSNKDRV